MPGSWEGSQIDQKPGSYCFPLQPKPFTKANRRPKHALLLKTFRETCRAEVSKVMGSVVFVLVKQ